MNWVKTQHMASKITVPNNSMQFQFDIIWNKEKRKKKRKNTTALNQKKPTP